jgi:hypothetical protein
MINRVGLQGLVKTLSPQSTSDLKKNAPSFFTGRIIDVILDENHPSFISQGEWNSIGNIKFKSSSINGVGSTKIAKPLYPNIKHYPVIGELVLIFPVQTPMLISEGYIYEYYYINGVSFWNHPHHNSIPIVEGNSLPPSQQLDYQQIEGGLVRRVTDNSTEIDLNSPFNPSQNTFQEKSNIHPLLSFSGDIIYEGRWGNSLRFGNTAKSKSIYKNNWSENGENGDPITILRNGQKLNSTEEGWIPITEDIKNDLSSIYLTSYQKLPFSLSNENFTSYTTPPTTPSQFTKPQIILNSDRIILNAKSDSILISGQTSVGLSSNNSINVESTSEINIASKLIRLGNKNANQSVLKGDDTVEYLKILITELQNITEALKVVQDWPGGAPTPNPVVLTTANSALQVFTNVYNQIDSIKSKIVKTS